MWDNQILLSTKEEILTKLETKQKDLAPKTMIYKVISY